MMPDLPDVGLERDLESFKEFFESPAFRADGLKIYPTLVIRGTGLYELCKTSRPPLFSLGEGPYFSRYLVVVLFHAVQQLYYKWKWEEETREDRTPAEETGKNVPAPTVPIDPMPAPLLPL